VGAEPKNIRNKYYVLGWHHQQHRWMFWELEDGDYMCGRCEDESPIYDAIDYHLAPVKKRITIQLIKHLVEQMNYE